MGGTILMWAGSDLRGVAKGQGRAPRESVRFSSLETKQGGTNQRVMAESEVSIL